MSNLLSNIPYELFSYIGGGIFLFIILYKFFPKLFIKIHKPVFFTIGILSLSLGYVGIVIPGLPTTVFILIAAWAFSKCSERFTFWIENHRIFGPIILDEMLPEKLKSCVSLDSFKKSIKEWIPTNCKCDLCKTYVLGVGYIDITD